MRTVNKHEAKTDLSRLVDQAAKGEPFIIARAGKPLVRVERSFLSAPHLSNPAPTKIEVVKMTKKTIVETFIAQLQRTIGEAQLPDSFYGSFDYTKTGRNLCHPITLSIIDKIVAGLPSVAHVGIDVKLNRGNGIKFQPDVVGFAQDLKRHLIYVDFESPNSCDSRIPCKDIIPYTKWTGDEDAAPYILITSLPDSQNPRWQLRYPKWKCNNGHNVNEIRGNPFRYWLADWRKNIQKTSNNADLSRVTLLNIDERSVRRFDVLSGA